MTRKWSVMDLVTDHKTGKLRETAVWSNVGKATMTWAFVWVIADGGDSQWLWAAYGLIVLGHESTSRFFNQRQQQIDDKEKKDV